MSRLVLLAENDAICQKLTSAVILQLGYEFKIVENGQDCLDVILGGMNPDLLLMDLDIPIMNGMEVLAILQENGETERFLTSIQ
ncbi:MAG: response regulator [Oligoflexus sp.]